MMIIVGVVVGTVVLVGLLVLIFCLYKRKLAREGVAN